MLPDFKRSVAEVDLGVTGCEFALADTGTVVISTAERNRLISLLDVSEAQEAKQLRELVSESVRCQTQDRSLENGV